MVLEVLVDDKAFYLWRTEVAKISARPVSVIKVS